MICFGRVSEASRDTGDAIMDAIERREERRGGKRDDDRAPVFLIFVVSALGSVGASLFPSHRFTWVFNGDKFEGESISAALSASL